MATASAPASRTASTTRRTASADGARSMVPSASTQLLQTKAQLRRRQRLWLLLHEVIQRRASLPRQFQQVLEARCGDQRRPRALPLQQRVGRDGCAMHEHGVPLRPRAVSPRAEVDETLQDGPRRVVGRRRDFVDAQPVGAQHHQVREGAARVYAHYNQGQSILPDRCLGFEAIPTIVPWRESGSDVVSL